jgi:hypothetical protein
VPTRYAALEDNLLVAATDRHFGQLMLGHQFDKAAYLLGVNHQTGLPEG